MAIAASYRFDHLKATVIIHDDFLEPQEKRQEIYERVFRYVENAVCQSVMRETGGGGDG